MSSPPESPATPLLPVTPVSPTSASKWAEPVDGHKLCFTRVVAPRSPAGRPPALAVDTAAVPAVLAPPRPPTLQRENSSIQSFVADNYSFGPPRAAPSPRSPGLQTPHPLDHDKTRLPSANEFRAAIQLPEHVNRALQKRSPPSSFPETHKPPHLSVVVEDSDPYAAVPEPEFNKTYKFPPVNTATVRPHPHRSATEPAMSGETMRTETRGKLHQPRDLLFIDQDVTPKSTAVTPVNQDVSDPMAAAGAALKGANGAANGGNGNRSPPAVMETVYAQPRQGRRRDEDIPLPAVNASAEEYYSSHMWSRARTFSNAGTAGQARGPKPVQMDGGAIARNRRLSHDEVSASAPRRYLIDVEETLRIVLAQEDTDHNYQISVYDSGPKLLALGTASSNATKTFDIRGTYMLSNLLQELALAHDNGRKRIVLDEARLNENPVDRLSRMIKNSFWNALTRRIDAQGVRHAANDPKNRSRELRSRIYVPHTEDDQIEYYEQIARDQPDLNLEVVRLPPKCDDPDFVKSLNDKPGILALAMKKNGVDPETGKAKLEAIPFVVPGARFNEMYYWDSYFMALGLLVDDRFDLAMGIVEHCIFQIKHYNKVLNGNRSYYLARSQPPFLTDLIVQIYGSKSLATRDRETLNPWLKRAISAAIKEYHCYWMVEPSLDTDSGLSRYRPGGTGIPPETEASHFTHILQPYAQKLGISVNDYVDGYNARTILEPELDEYFTHDRGVRESGHDTTYRLDMKAADLATVDLNSLLYKYEVDIANAIENVFGDALELEEEFELSPWPITPEAFAAGAKRELSTSRVQTSAEWRERANRRQQQMDALLWNDGAGMYFDWDTKAKKQARYESATTFWPLWAGCASEEQAISLAVNALPKFEVAGGLVSGTEESRGIISLDRPNRQWDYPYGWPPHQIMAWVGFERYGMGDHASRLAYRWIYMMTLSFVDFNGIVPEKFDAVELSHMVDAEYGNQGVDFKMVPREGFGWMNAAYQTGLSFLTVGQRRAAAACVPPWVYFNLPAPDFPSARIRRAEREARDAAAAASGHGGQPKKEKHQELPTLEQIISQMKMEFNVK